jgi:hypothetical protein
LQGRAKWWSFVIMSSSRLPDDLSGTVDAPSSSERLFPGDRLSALHWLGLILAAVLVVLFALPSLLRRPYDEGTPESVNNLKQLSLTLADFDDDYGRFPDASTVAAVQKATGTTFPLGDRSSNELFRQLIASTAKSESIFWAWTSFTPRKPDNDLSSEKALSKGECAFTYIAGLSRADPGDTPLAMSGVIPGTWNFDPKADKKSAAVLFIDGSVKRYPLDKDGNVTLSGMNFFDPRQPHWHGKVPDIKWPE